MSISLTYERATYKLYVKIVPVHISNSNFDIVISQQLAVWLITAAHDTNIASRAAMENTNIEEAY